MAPYAKQDVSERIAERLNMHTRITAMNIPHIMAFGDTTMMTQTRKTDLSPVEAILVERALGEEARRNAHSGTMARIQQLTAERQKLYAESASHPLLGPSNAGRIKALGAEIDRLWNVLRRERATRRVQLERALNVRSDDDDDERDSPRQIMETPGDTDAA
jgi:hypothetical protein